jgi:hypothetical protein
MHSSSLVWFRVFLACCWGFACVLASLAASLVRAEEPKEGVLPPLPVEAAAKKEGKEEKKEDGPKYIRVTRNDKEKPVALQTNIVHFTKPAENPKDPPIRIDLVGAVHVGEKSYYKDLNKRFADYEVVLYELVAPEGTRVPKGGERKGVPHPVAGVQLGMKQMLELEFQLEQVDYQKENFVHADMSPEEMDKTMKDRGESFAQMFLRMMGSGMAQGQKEGGGDVDILFAFFAKDRARKLKTAMAKQFEDMDGQMAVFEGEEGSTIITERNRKAFEVLAKQLKEGKKHIAIFYGAGHLSDMEKRLVKDFGCKREGEEEWLTAWKLD